MLQISIDGETMSALREKWRTRDLEYRAGLVVGGAACAALGIAFFVVLVLTPANPDTNWVIITIGGDALLVGLVLFLSGWLGQPTTGN